MAKLLLVGILSLALSTLPAYPDIEGFLPTEHLDLGQGTGLIRLVDLDGDDFPDIIAESEGDVILHRNQGDGTFVPETAASMGVWIYRIEPVDLNGDEHPDLFCKIRLPFASPSAAVPGYAVLINDGDGRFTVDIEGLTEELEDLQLADLDGDGDVDVLYELNWHLGDYGFGTFLNDGDGTFESGPSIPMPDRHFGDAALGDIDGDGKPELALEHRSDVEVYRNLGGLTFDIVPMLVLEHHSGPKLLDVDGDGFLDLVSHDRDGAEVRWGQAGGGLSDGQVIGDLHNSWFTSDDETLVADADGDGDLDVTGVAYGGFVAFRENLDGRTFGEVIFHRYGESVRAHYVVGADLDGDGDSELLIQKHDRCAIVRPGGVAAPVVTGATSSSTAPGELNEIVVTGTGFTPDTNLFFRRPGTTFDADLEILDVTHEGPERIVISARNPLANVKDPRDIRGETYNLWVEDTAGGATRLPGAVTVDSWWNGEIDLDRASFRVDPRPGKDRLKVKGGFYSLDSDDLVAEAGQDFALKIGNGTEMLEIVIPGDGPGWKVKPAKRWMKYKSPKGVKPRVKLWIKNKGTFELELTVKDFDFGPTQVGYLRAEFHVGDLRIMGDAGAGEETKPGSGKYKIR